MGMTPKHIKLSEGQGVPLATPQPFPLHTRLPTASRGFPPLENLPRQRAFLSLATLSAAVPLHPCHTERKNRTSRSSCFLLFRVSQRSKIAFGNFQYCFIQTLVPKVFSCKNIGFSAAQAARQQHAALTCCRHDERNHTAKFHRF